MATAYVLPFYARIPVRETDYDERYQLPYDCLMPALTALELSCEAEMQLSTLRNYLTYSISKQEENIPFPKFRLQRLHSILSNLMETLAYSAQNYKYKLHCDYISTDSSDNPCLIYDHYFGFARYDCEDTNSVYFIIEAIRILKDAVQDLMTFPSTVDEMLSLWRAIETMALIFSEECGIDLESTVFKTTTLHDHIPISENESEYAFSRWRLHHAVFALWAIMASTELKKPVTSTSIKRAANFLRATTSAMWHATGFSSDIYNHMIRPSMKSEKTPNGFSGHHNKDFTILLENLRAFLEKLKKGSYPDNVLKAAQILAETYIEDANAHIIIAVQKVGQSPSLETEKLVQNYGASTESAADILRRIVMQRKYETAFLFNL